MNKPPDARCPDCGRKNRACKCLRLTDRSIPLLDEEYEFLCNPGAQERCNLCDHLDFLHNEAGDVCHVCCDVGSGACYSEAFA
jgi:hypothetical protein